MGLLTSIVQKHVQQVHIVGLWSRRQRREKHRVEALDEDGRCFGAAAQTAAKRRMNANNVRQESKQRFGRVYARLHFVQLGAHRLAAEDRD